MKTVLVLPGWHHDPAEKRYTNIVEFFHAAGFDVRTHNPDWDKRNTSDWVNDLLADLPDDKSQLTLFGFSMGAMISLLAATHIPVENLILCSPSGYFREYTLLLGDEDAKWAQDNIKDFEELSVSSIFKQIKVQNGYILAGDREFKQWPDFEQWIGDLKMQTNWPLTTIPDTGHEIEATGYQYAVANLIQQLPHS